jgi:hypothetical protein
MGQIKAKSMDDTPEEYDQHSELSVSVLINLFYGSVIEDLSGDIDDTEPVYSNADIVAIMKRNAYEMAGMLNSANTDMESGIAINVAARRALQPLCRATADNPVYAGCMFDECDTCRYNKKNEDSKDE